MMKLAPQKRYSHQGEEGVIDGILRAIGVVPEMAMYVDLGAGDGTTGSNTLALAEQGWAGVAIEADPNAYQKMHDNYKAFFAVRPVHKLVTCEKGNTLNEILREAGAPADFDLLTIDVDGNDYWIWQELTFRPKVVVIEYNANFEPHESRVIAYDPAHRWTGDAYYGASAKALRDLGKEKGYELVYFIEPSNLFFVRREWAHLFEPVGDVPKHPIHTPSPRKMIEPRT